MQANADLGPVRLIPRILLGCLAGLALAALVYLFLPMPILIHQAVYQVIATGALIIGFIGAVMGIGGGFFLIPAMIYMLGMPTAVVIGTSLFQIIFTSAYTTLVHATTNQTVDVVLAFILMAGGVAGAQYGAKAGQRLRGEQLRARKQRECHQ